MLREVFLHRKVASLSAATALLSAVSNDWSANALMTIHTHVVSCALRCVIAQTVVSGCYSMLSAIAGREVPQVSVRV